MKRFSETYHILAKETLSESDSMTTQKDYTQMTQEELLAELAKRDAQIDGLERRVDTLGTVFQPDFPVEEEAWLAPFISRFTLDEGNDGQPDVHIESTDKAGKDLWLVRIGGKLLNKSGELEEDIWFEADDWNPFLEEDENRLLGSLKDCYDRAMGWIKLNLDPDDIVLD